MCTHLSRVCKTYLSQFSDLLLLKNNRISFSLDMTAHLRKCVRLCTVSLTKTHTRTSLMRQYGTYSEARDMDLMQQPAHSLFIDVQVKEQ